MDVAITALRAHLSEWIDHARSGEDVIVTDHGVPVARLVGVRWADRLEQLTADGTIARPGSSERPRATGRKRAKATGPVSELVAADRDRTR